MKTNLSSRFSIVSMLLTICIFLSLPGCTSQPPAVAEVPTSTQTNTTMPATATLPPTITSTTFIEPTSTIEPTATQILPTPKPTRTRLPDGQEINIQWFVGIGTGSTADHVQKAKEYAQKYNDLNNGIKLEVVSAASDSAGMSMLQSLIALDKAPDIVGPIGIAGSAVYADNFLDLSAVQDDLQIQMDDIDPAIINYYKMDGKVVAAPFSVYPSALFVNLKLFFKANLTPPPNKYGVKYKWPDGTEEDWSFETMTKLAKMLTLDKNGHNATQPEFNKNQIVQYGFSPEWVTEPRALASYFGAGYPVSDEGMAQIPEVWKAAWIWYYQGMWGDDRFIPNGPALQSMEGNAFSTGKVAMALSHSWYTCCINTQRVPNWKVAAVPSYQGKTTAKLHMDVFAILKGSKHPQEAAEVLSYMLGQGVDELYDIYEAIPVRNSKQQMFVKNLQPDYVDWEVFLDSIQYMDVPNHEMTLPNHASAIAAFDQLGKDLRTLPNLDLDAYLEQFTKRLNTIYKNKK